MSGDLVVVVPDKDIEQSVRGLLAHPQKLRIRPINGVQLLVHPNRDPGVYHTGHELISGYVDDFAHALLILDFAWQGRPTDDAAEMATQVETHCRRARWEDRARCIVINPEIEIWVWSDSLHVATALGWGSMAELREWLQAENLWPEEAAKPPDPKAAFEAALRKKRIPPSAAIFRKLADQVSFQRCKDASFTALTGVLRGWFPSPA